MTKRWLCNVVAVLCCLLAFATSVHAECAWVLWNGQERLLPDDRRVTPGQRVIVWEPIKTEATESKCRPQETPGMKVTDTAGNRVHSFMVCFPDTIDPRALSIKRSSASCGRKR